MAPDRYTLTDGPTPFRRRQYEFPPVVEGIARLVWAQPAEWSVTTPGSLYERLKDKYPGKPEARSLFQAGVGQSSPSEAGAGVLEFTSGPQEMIFTDANRGQMLIVGPQSVSAHALPPYEGWESLSSRLSDAYPIAASTLDASESFAQVSLRYINRVDLDETNIQLGEYLTIQFTLPPAFPTQLGGFLDRVEVFYPDEPIKLTFTWASQPSEEGRSSFVIDLDLTYNPTEPVSLPAATEMLQEMKRRETQAFEGLLQDKLRKVFHELG